LIVNRAATFARHLVRYARDMPDDAAIPGDVDLSESSGKRTIRVGSVAGCNAMLDEKLCGFAKLFGLRP